MLWTGYNSNNTCILKKNWLERGRNGQEVELAVADDELEPRGRHDNGRTYRERPAEMSELTRSRQDLFENQTARGKNGSRGGT
jgi:hypothetical protein